MDTLPIEPEASGAEDVEKAAHRAKMVRDARRRENARGRLVRQAVVVAVTGLLCPLFGASGWYAVGLVAVGVFGIALSRLLAVKAPPDTDQDA